MDDTRERETPVPSALPMEWMARMLLPFQRGSYTKSELSLLPDSLKQQQKRRGRSIYLRHVDCGSCGACEVELSALDNPVYDIRRLGMEFRSTPRQAHLLVLTGPYTRNMDLEVWQALQVMAQRFSREETDDDHLGCVILLGDCAIHGGIFERAHGLAKRAQTIEREIVARIFGCPPTPEEILGALDVVAKYLETRERNGTLSDIDEYVIHKEGETSKGREEEKLPLDILDLSPTQQPMETVTDEAQVSQISSGANGSVSERVSAE